MTTFEHWRSPASRFAVDRHDRRLKKYDVRIVDQFYAYTQAIARTDRHRDEAFRESLAHRKRQVWATLLAGGLLCYYVVERVAQAMSIY